MNEEVPALDDQQKIDAIWEMLRAMDNETTTEE